MPLLCLPPPPALHQLPPPGPSRAADPASIRLALAIARRKGKRYPSLADEFEAEAVAALVTAERSFDESRGVPFLKFAPRAIACALIDCQRRWTPRGYRGRRDGIPAVGSLADTPAEALAFEGEPVGAGAEYEDEVEHYAAMLPPRHSAYFRARFGRAAAQGTALGAGRLVGMDRTTASQVHRESLTLIREALACPA